VLVVSDNPLTAPARLDQPAATRLHPVSLVGFGSFERSTFDLFFRTSALRALRPPAQHPVNPVREHGYRLVPPQDQPELVLINGDLRLAARQAWRWPGRCISVGESSFEGALAHLERPVPMNRLLDVMDDLVRHQPPPPGFEASAPPADVSLTSVRLLVVDDNERTRRSIARYLVHLGADAHYAASGEEGLYRVAQKPYELVLLDAHMPGISGWLTCRLIKRRPYAEGLQAPRVLIMSRPEGPLDRWRELRCRCDGRLPKPLQKTDLLAAVRPFL
jgi:CheY-like chemotaxis protein